jgi:hypothetical protein
VHLQLFLFKNFLHHVHTISYFRKINIMSVEENSSNISKPKKQTSWIWQYFKEEAREIKKGEESVNILIMKCQVKEHLSLNICGTEYVQKDLSTGNAISYLCAKHNIIQSGKVGLYAFYYIIYKFFFNFNNSVFQY